jgi:hypothetical protein
MVYLFWKSVPTLFKKAKRVSPSKFIILLLKHETPPFGYVILLPLFI